MIKAMWKRSTLLLLLVFGLALNACKDYDGIEMIIVNKIPMGAWATGDDPNNFYGIGWYNIGLSRNGKEPIEYIWRAGTDPYSYAIMHAEIGANGTIYLQEWAIENRIKMPRPNAKNPPNVGALGEVYWRKVETSL